MSTNLSFPNVGAPPTVQELRALLASLPATPRLHDLQTAAIDQALTLCDGNRTAAAKALGISVRTLQRKLKNGDGNMTHWDCIQSVGEP